MRFATLALSILLLPACQAELLTLDSSYGPGTITYDTESGLRWLDLTVTAGLTWNQAVQELQPEGNFEGWRHARPSDLLTLYSHAGIQYPDTQNSVDVDAVRDLMNLFGGPLGHGVGFPWQDDRSAGYHTFNGQWAEGSDLVIYYFAPNNIQARATSQPILSSDPNFALPDTGHWLVQAVPEPSAVAAVVSGLLALGVRAAALRRR